MAGVEGQETDGQTNGQRGAEAWRNKDGVVPMIRSPGVQDYERPDQERLSMCKEAI